VKGLIGLTTVNVVNEKNPFRIACFLGDFDIASLLIEQGADPNYIDAEGNPILFYVVKSGDAELCTLLLKHGAKINLKNNKGVTALDCCFISNSTDSRDDAGVERMYDFLITSGAKLTPHILDSAIKGQTNDGYCDYSIIQKITKQLVSSGQKTGLSPLLESAVLRDLPTFNSLIINENNIDQKVLFFTAAFGNVEALQTLFKKGLDINSTDEDSNTLLAIAARTGNIGNIKYLMTKLDINKNKGLYSPLELAVSNNQLEAVKFLIKNGAKINSHFSETDPLSKACKNGNLDIVKILCENGYPWDGRSQALQKAAQYNRVEILNYLINKGYNINSTFNNSTALGTAAMSGNMDCVKFLVSHGANIYGDKKYSSPLSDACYNGQTEVARYLIENGADINTPQDKTSNQLPLHEAVSCGSMDTVKLLVEHGARIDDSVLAFAKDCGSTNIYNYLKKHTND